MKRAQGQDNKKFALTDILCNWDELQKWLKQMDEKQINQQTIQTLQQMVQPQACYTNQNFLVLTDVFALITQHPKWVQEREKFLLQTIEMMLHLNAKIPTLSHNQKPYRLLIAVFKLLQSILAEIKDPEKYLIEQKPSLPEQVFKLVFRYLYIGITKFQQQLFLSTPDFNGSSSSGGISSSSDVENSFAKEGTGAFKLVEKLRSQAMVLLQQIIRQLPKTVLANWQLLLKSTAFSQVFFQRSMQINNRADDDQMVKSEFNEPSLLATLLFEPQKKVRLNAMSALIILFDNLALGKWIIGHDFEKYEKQLPLNKQSFQPKAYQFYTAAKNMHLCLLYVLSTQIRQHHDLQIITMVLKLYQIVLNSTSIMDKLADEIGVTPVCSLYLLPFLSERYGGDRFLAQFTLQENRNLVVNVKICSLQVLQCLVVSPSKFIDGVMTGSYPLHLFALEEIQHVIDENQHENLNQLYLQELFSLLCRLQRVYQHILFKDQCFWIQFSDLKLKLTQDAGLVQWFKVVEEIIKHLPASASQTENLDFDNEKFGDYECKPILELKKQPSKRTEELIKFEIYFLDDIIPGFIRELFETPNPELLIAGLNILTELPLPFWSSNIDLLEKVSNRLATINEQIFIDHHHLSTSSLRIQFYRCLGILTTNPSVDKALLMSFFTRAQQKLEQKVQINVHVLEKMSWALANVCSNITTLDGIHPDVTSKIFSLLLQLSGSGKEKLATNCLRGLGHFMHRVNENILEQCPQILSSIEGLITCYEKSLMNKNSKISWNASYSLNNLIIGPNIKLSGQVVNSRRIQLALLHVMQNRGNLKILIHCFELLLSIQKLEQSFLDEWNMELIQQTIAILQELEDIQTYLEQNYQSKLRHQLFQLLATIFKVTKSDTFLSFKTIQEQLHDNKTLTRIIEEQYELLLQFGKQCPLHSILWVRSDVSREQLMTSKQDNENEPIYSIHKLQEESETASNTRYLRVEQPSQALIQAIQLVQTVSNQILHFVNQSDQQVSFHLVEALEELIEYKESSSTVLVKLQI